MTTGSDGYNCSKVSAETGGRIFFVHFNIYG
jgi:hypothetical protein